MGTRMDPGRRPRGSKLVWGSALSAVLGVAALASLAFAPARHATGDVASAPTPAAVGRGIASPLEAALDPGRGLRAAIAAQEQGDTDRAVSLLAATGRLHPVIGDHAALLRIRFLLDAGRAREGLAVAADALADYPDSPLRTDFFRVLGDLRAASGQEAAAREAWQAGLEATRSSRRRADFRAALAASFERSGDLTAASELWLSIWRYHPTREPAAEAAARLDALERYFRRPIRTAVDWRRRGDRLFAKRRNEQALEAFDTALAMGLPKPEARRATQQRAHTLFRLRRYPEAAATFASLPSEPEIRLWHARSVARAGDVPRSVRELEKLGRENRGSISVRATYLAALLLDGEGDDARARKHFATVARQGRGSGLAAGALWRLGWADYRAGRWADAVGWFEQLAQADRDPIGRLRARYWRARALEHASPEAARSEFVALAEEFPLSYYGWRAAERAGSAVGARPGLDLPTPDEERGIPLGRRKLQPAELERPRILLAAGLVEEAREELDRARSSARGLADRLDLASLYTATGDPHRAQRLMVDAYTERLARGPLAGFEEVWWYAYPRAYADMVDAATADGRSVRPDLVYSIMREESGYRPEVLSVSGARGLLQIMPTTGERLARDVGMQEFDPDDLFDPGTNIDLGSTYLGQLSRRFDGWLAPAIASYNAGPAAVTRWVRRSPGVPEDEWVESIPYEQTRLYVKRVLRTMRAYRVLY